MIKFYSVLTFVLFSFAAIAQDTSLSTLSAPQSDFKQSERRNFFTIEVLGKGGLYSVNYERWIMPQLTLGLGFAAYNVGDGDSAGRATVLPLYGNYYFSRAESRFFVTSGADLILADAAVAGKGTVRGNGVGAVFGGGYEYRSPEGFIFRVSPYQMFGKVRGTWLGLSLGYSI